MSRPELGASLNLSIDILPMDAPNRPKPKNGKDRTLLDALNFITVHETDNFNRGADAQAHRRFLNNGGGQHRVSWHFTVDEDEVVKHMRINERGVHANAGNRQSVGIETCVDEGSDIAKTRDRAARLVAVLLHDTGLGIGRVVQHNHWSGKNCPRKLRAGEHGMAWNGFLERVEKHLAFANEDGPLGAPEAAVAMMMEEGLETGVELEPEPGEEEEGFEDDLHEGMPEKFLSVEKPGS